MSRIPLALLPGTLCNATLWEAQRMALSDITDISIIDTSQHDNLASLAEYVHEQMPERFAVAGLSYGGIVAFAVWRHNPTAISHLALMNTTYLPITPEKQAGQEKLVQTAFTGGFSQVVADNARNILSLLDEQPDSTLASKVVAMAEEVGVNGFVNQIRSQIQRPDSGPLLEKIQCPTLVLCGEQDRFCPPEIHREMAMRISHSMLEIVPNCGHLSTLEQPAYLSQTMRRWLQM